MKLAYLAGAYSGNSETEKQRNIAKAAIWGAWLFSQGYSAFIPHRNTANYDLLDGIENFNRELWIEADLKLLRAICIMGGEFFVIPGWHNSPGTKREVGEWNGVLSALSPCPHLLCESDLPIAYQIMLLSIDAGNFDRGSGVDLIRCLAELLRRHGVESGDE